MNTLKTRLARSVAALGLMATILSPQAQASSLPKAKGQHFIAFSDSCVFSPQTSAGQEFVGGVLLAIGQAVLPALTSFAFDKVVERIERRQLEYSSSASVASENANFFKGEAANAPLNVGCLIVVRKNPDAELTDEFKKELITIAKVPNGDWGVVAQELKQKVIGLTLGADEYPELVLELAIKSLPAKSNNGDERTTGFRLEPVFLAYGGSATKRNGKQDEKDVSFSVSLESFVPTKTSFEQKIVYSSDFIFEDIPFGTVSKKDRNTSDSILVGMGGPWAPIPARAFKLDNKEYRTAGPTVAKVTISETETKGDLTGILLKAIQESKSEITGPIDEALVAALSRALGQQDNQDEDD